MLAKFQLGHPQWRWQIQHTVNVMQNNQVALKFK